MEAPRIPGFFKNKGPRRFNFPARYYDEQQERIDKRREALKRELKADSTLSAEDKEKFKDLMRQNSRHGLYRKSAKKSNLRFAIILMFLIAIFYWLWNKAELVL